MRLPQLLLALSLLAAGPPAGFAATPAGPCSSEPVPPAAAPNQPGLGEPGPNGRAQDSPAPATGSQADDSQAPAPDAAARIGDEVVTLEEYKAYLLTVYGKRDLRNLINARLIEAEAARLGLSVLPGELDEVVAQQIQTLMQRHRGDEEIMRRELAAEGFTPESYGDSIRARTRTQLLAERICTATRTLTPEQVRERFDREYGVDGVKVEVRHLFLNPAKYRRELERQGEDPATLTPARVEQLLAARARGLLQEITRGDFETVARAHSHDISVRVNGGMIPGYNYRRYGPELAAGVRAAEVGIPTGPIQSATGTHLIEVLSRKVTRFEDVRADVEALLMAEKPNGEELRDLELRLRRETPVEIY